MKIRSVDKDPITGRFLESVIDVVLVGYHHFDRRGTHADKPTDGGFAIVLYPDGGEGAIPLNNILNWDELPERI